MSTATVAATRRIVSVNSSVEEQSDLVFDDVGALEARLRQEAGTLGEGGAWLIAWLDYVVLVGLVTPEQVQTRQALEPHYLQELRLFGRHGEWRLRRAGEQFQARRRLDGAGAPGEALEDDQSLWGTAVEPVGASWTALLEGRGIRYDLPRTVQASDLPLRLQLRHYLGSDAAGLIGVTDSRCLAICNQRGEPLIEGDNGHV